MSGHFAGWNPRDLVEIAWVVGTGLLWRHVRYLRMVNQALRRELRETARFADGLQQANRQREEGQKREPWVGR